MSTLLPNLVIFHLHRKINVQTLTGLHQRGEGGGVRASGCCGLEGRSPWAELRSDLMSVACHLRVAVPAGRC
jgi:hypothetical protein